MPSTLSREEWESLFHTLLVREGVRVFNQGNNPSDTHHHQYRQLVRHMGNILYKGNAV